jgi:hypothetical protein
VCVTNKCQQNSVNKNIPHGILPRITGTSVATRLQKWSKWNRQDFDIKGVGLNVVDSEGNKQNFFCAWALPKPMCATDE